MHNENRVSEIYIWQYLKQTFFKVMEITKINLNFKI